MIWQKIQETLEHFWLKLSMAVPIGFFLLEEREAVMIFALAVIITVDCIFGAMLAWQCGKFDWSTLGKKFSKKFLLYFFTLLASFVMHNAFKEMLEWWFYTIGSIITLSEFGSLMNKASMLGLPVQADIFTSISDAAYKKFCKVMNVKPKKRNIE